MPPLDRAMLAPNPIAQFAAWWELAEREVPLRAMALAASMPRASFWTRGMAAFKGFGADGFRFFATNRESAKAEQIAGAERRPWSSTGARSTARSGSGWHGRAP